MALKSVITLTIISLLVVQTLGFPLKNRFKRSDDEDDNESARSPLSGLSRLPGIQFASQQDSQSSQEHSSNKNGAQTQQQLQGQQQLGAVLNGKAYLLQQQMAMGQQLAKLGRKSAIQQLVDTQKQSVADGREAKSSHTAAKDDLKEDKEDSNSEVPKVSVPTEVSDCTSTQSRERIEVTETEE